MTAKRERCEERSSVRALTVAKEEESLLPVQQREKAQTAAKVKREGTVGTSGARSLSRSLVGNVCVSSRLLACVSVLRVVSDEKFVDRAPPSSVLKQKSVCG